VGELVVFGMFGCVGGVDECGDVVGLGCGVLFVDGCGVLVGFGGDEVV